MSLSVCIITKNEENNISKCIESVYDIADEIIITDTGSTDKTIEIASSFDKVKIFNFNWVDDFSKAKNYCISHAKSDWILSIDSDEVFSSNINLKHYLESNFLEDKAYVINFKVNNYSGAISLNFFSRALFKNNQNIFFRGSVHEYLYSNKKLEVHNDSNFLLIHNVNKKNIPKTEYYIKLIHKELELSDNTFDLSHYYYHLSNEYGKLRQIDKSLNYLEKSIEILPDKARYIKLIRELIINKKDSRKIIDISFQAFEKHKNDIEISYYYAYSLILSNEYDKLINVIKNILSKINESKYSNEFKLEIIEQSKYLLSRAYLNKHNYIKSKRILLSLTRNNQVENYLNLIEYLTNKSSININLQKEQISYPESQLLELLGV